MKGMPLPFEFEGKGAVVLRQPAAAEFVVPCAEKLVYFQGLGRLIGEEPKSVLENINSSPSPPTSTSTLSSSLGGGGGGGAEAVGVAAVSASPWPQLENQENSSSNVGVVELHHHRQLPEQSVDATGEKCGEMEDWESVLSESGQEQSILRWIMGDVEDPSMGLNKMLHGGGTAEDVELAAGFGGVDQGFLGFDSNNPVGQIGNFYQIPHKLTTEKTGFSSNLRPPPPSTFSDHHHHQKLFDHHNPTFSQQNPPENHTFDVKPQIFNPQFIINQNQSHPQQNPPFFIPLENHHHHHHHHLAPPPPKRHNTGISPSISPIHKTPFQLLQQQPSSVKKPSAIDEPELHYHHQAITDHLFKAADTLHSGNNPILAQAILARLNHQLSPVGNPFYRAAFYFKESLQSLSNSTVNNTNPQPNPIPPPFTLIYKINAYKSFSEVSPFIHFTNFTCNQSLLETLDGFSHIHIVDFDLTYGGQWASFLQELALQNTPPSLKITAFASPTTHDQLELTLTRENLTQFAREINIKFAFEIVNLDILASASWALPFRVSEQEVVAVNLPVSVVSAHPLVLRFIKNLAPKIVVSVDKACEMTDLPFPNHLVHALQSYANLIESLDAVNMNPDVLQKIERFLIQPTIEKIVTGGFLSRAKVTQHWRAQFLSAGFLPLTFSNFTESQAECVVKRAPVRGFHVEKRQSTLALCWQRQELVSASAWRC